MAYQYDSLLSLKGAGNSALLLNYSAAEDKPLTGDSYYRLRQTDYDGKSSLSNAVHINMGLLHTYHIYPNPSAKNVIYINENGKKKWIM